MKTFSLNKHRLSGFLLIVFSVIIIASSRKDRISETNCIGYLHYSNNVPVTLTKDVELRIQVLDQKTLLPLKNVRVECSGQVYNYKSNCKYNRYALPTQVLFTNNLGVTQYKTTTTSTSTQDFVEITYWFELDNYQSITRKDSRDFPFLFNEPRIAYLIQKDSLP